MLVVKKDGMSNILDHSFSKLLISPFYLSEALNFAMFGFWMKTTKKKNIRTHDINGRKREVEVENENYRCATHARHD